MVCTTLSVPSINIFRAKPDRSMGAPLGRGKLSHRDASSAVTAVMILLILTYCLVAASVGQLTEDECFLCPEKEVEEGRILWGALGTLFEQLPFLPITINVPDILYGMSDMMYNMYQYVFGGGGSSGTSSTNSNTPRELYTMIELLL